MTGVRLIVLGSSSSGNATLVEAEGGSMLVDAGFSCRELLRRMDALGADPTRLTALVLSHEHSDHVAGARVLARRLDIPVYGTRGTLAAASPALSGLDLRPRDLGAAFDHGPFSVTLVPVPHDAREPAAVRVDVSGRHLMVATDMGSLPPAVLEAGRGADGLVLESNHDERMLLDGPYPQFLKRRILGPLGHLSNAQSASALRQLVGPGTRGVLLGHLSQRNNTERLALRTVTDPGLGDLPAGLEVRTTAPGRSEALEL